MENQLTPVSLIFVIFFRWNIIETSDIIKDWNPGWKPLYFIPDYSDEEITSVETVFPDNSNSIRDIQIGKNSFQKKYLYIRL